MKSSAIEMGRKKVEDVPTASSVDKDEVSESSPSKPGSKKPSDSGGVRKRPIEKTWKELSETINRELTERSITSLMLETGPVRKKPSSVSEDIKSMNPPRDLVGPPVLKLRFINSPPPTIFTDSRIMGEDGTPLKIELVDASTNTRIHSFFPLDIVLLNADIREEGWSKEEFYRNILRPRKGKRALLVGDLTVTLEHGLGMISGNVAFTGNSRSRKFRLGAKLTQGGNVQGAITKTFSCIDKRGKSSHKQYSASKVSKLARGSVVDMQQDGLHNSVYNGVNLLQEDELSIIGFNEFQSGPVSDASDTSATFPASKDYDVVIRHGGNNDFISHLRAALSRRGISVHEDVEETTDAAVPECRVLIIFLTTTYVPSNLLNILQHQRQESLMVYPIFYGISPSDLITNSNYYENFFPQDESERCQAALKEITQMPRYILIDKYESELIDEIVRDALKVIYSTEHEKMIGMDMQIKEIVSLLCIESPDVRSVGIWGAVGIGKTALAEEIFCRISVQFVTCVFLKDLHKEVQVKGQDALREDFLSKVLEVEPHVIRVSGMETSFLRSRVQRKKVLVVLDDVNDFRDVEIFLEELSYLGPGSRIIITSRDKRVFVLCKTDHVYEVKPLDFSKSLQILDRRIYSPELVKFSNGNPQVLQFLSRSNREWKRLSQEIQSSSPIYIQGIFERSCCGLDDIERSIFLDIACFFKRMNKNDVALLLDGRDFSPHVGFRSLVDKSLLTISHNMVDMPVFLQATGREIVRQESVDRPGDRSRLWNAEDIRDVFIDNTGTSAIEGIFLDMSQLKFDARPIVFMKMCNLRLLKLCFSKVKENNGVCLPQGLEYLPRKLRLLHWEYYPLSSLPQTFDPKNLVELNLPNSCAKKLWKGKKSLEKLKKLRLSHSYHLTKIPRLSSAPNLELLDLEGCNSLVSISQSICHLKKLVFLNLKDCSNLESVPSTVDLESLEVLNLSGCSKLENFPEISPNVKELYLGGTMIQEMPSSIKNLVLLEKLDLENSKYLKVLPTSICKLKHLETLNLSDCSRLERFPDLNRKMKCFKCLDLSRTTIKELPSSISYLTALEELRLVECKSLVRLPDNAWSLRFKVEFRQIDTDKFSKLWNRFAWLKKVQIS
ncbi:probable WRKY transcription factor 19 isoform X1 [Brassica napus]|uniref:probable WRKY transcription factor 19 isoform X1 n=1 Tax=Brassica napus TaxID=3708 RepID=UPI002078C738|nr:probable WRKY transcription factor 19 isoform X1 [Brassica napus]